MRQFNRDLNSFDFVHCGGLLMKRRILVIATSFIAIGAALAAAEDGKLSPVEKLPSGLADKVSAALNTHGQQVDIGAAAVCTVWLVKDLPVKADFKPTLSVKYPLAPGQLVGAMHVVKKSEFTDFRGQEVPAGVYTLRYGQQPVDGNHVGTSDLADFLLAIPAASDVDPATPKSPQDLFPLSAKTAGSNHPAIYSLLPPKADDKTPSLTHEKEFWVLRLTAEGKSGDTAVKVPLRVVIVGVSEG
jgi:hypothetical protein